MNFWKLLLKAKYFLFILFLDFLFYISLFLNPDKIISGADIQIVYSSYKLFFADSFKSTLQFPLWNPYILGGQPFLANPSSGMLYPLNLLFLVFKPDFVFGYIFVIDSALIGMFTYLYSRTIKVSEFGSLISAVVFMFSGTIVSRIFPGHLFIVDALIWFPLILFSLEKLIQTKKFIFCALSSFSIAFMILAGHSQISFYVIFISLVYAFLRGLSEDKKNIFKILLFLSSSIFLALCISAIQLLPTLEFSKLSVRDIGLSYNFTTVFSLPIYQILTLFIPQFFGNIVNSTFWGKGNDWELWLYVGILPLIFSGVALALKRSKLTFIFLFLIAFSLFFSLGKYFFVFGLFFNYIPFFNVFRVPPRMLFALTFSLAILTGIGIDFFLKSVFQNKINIKIVSFLTLFSSLLISILLIFLNFFNGYYFFEKLILKNAYAVGINHRLIFTQIIFDLEIMAFVLSAYFILFYLLKAKKINLFCFKALILIIVFFNLYTYLNKYIVLDYPKNVYKNNEIINIIKKDNGIFRTLDLTGNNYMDLSFRNNLQDATGVDAIFLNNYRDYIWSLGDYDYLPYESYIQINSVKNLNHFNLLNIKYLISGKQVDSDKFKLINKSLNIKFNNINYLYENKDYFPRAYISPSKDLNISKDLITKADIKNYSSNSIDVKAILEKPGFLVLSETWYPGWKAYDNNKEVPVLKIGDIFRGVYLEKGKHEIKFIFDPVSYKIGKLISVVTVILLLIIIFKNKFIYAYKYKLKLHRRI